jgi:hypothetical protein
MTTALFCVGEKDRDEVLAPESCWKFHPTIPDLLSTMGGKHEFFLTIAVVIKMTPILLIFSLNSLS